MAAEYLDGGEPKSRQYAPFDIDRVRANAQRKGGEEVHPKLRSMDELAASLPSDEMRDRMARAAQRWDMEEDSDWEEFPWVPWGNDNELIPLNVGEQLNKVLAAWRKSAEAIVATGKALNAMQKAVGHGNWGKVLKHKYLPFDERTVQRLQAIAEHPSLSDPTNSSDLPSAVDTLYKLSRLPGAAVDAMIKSGTVTARTTSAEVQNIYVFKLPKLLSDWIDIHTRYNPDEVMDHAGYELWRAHGSNTADLFQRLASVLTDLGAAYKRHEEEHSAQWQLWADAEDAAVAEAERANKLERARRKPKPKWSERRWRHLMP
jgi:hypothetical protein